MTTRKFICWNRTKDKILFVEAESDELAALETQKLGHADSNDFINVYPFTEPKCYQLRMRAHEL